MWSILRMKGYVIKYQRSKKKENKKQSLIFPDPKNLIFS